MDNQLAIAGSKPIAKYVASGVMNAKGTLVGSLRYICSKANYTDKLEEGMTRSKLVALLVEQKLATKDQCKDWHREYETARAEYHQVSRSQGALALSLPNTRVTSKPAFNAKGEVIGLNIAVRREPSKSMSAQAKVAALESKLTAVTALLKAHNIEVPAIA